MQVTILLSIFTGTGGLQRAGATVVVVESGGVSTLFMLYCYRCVAAGTSNHFHAVGKSKFRKTNSVFLRCSHRRGNNFDAHFLCHPKVLVATVKGIGQDFIRGKPTTFGAFDGRNQRMNVTLAGDLQFNMRDQVECLFPDLSVLRIAVGLHHLHLIPLPLVTIISSIGIRGILQRVGRNLLRRLDGNINRNPFRCRRYHALFLQYTKELIETAHGHNFRVIMESPG